MTHAVPFVVWPPSKVPEVRRVKDSKDNPQQQNRRHVFSALSGVQSIRLKISSCKIILRSRHIKLEMLSRAEESASVPQSPVDDMWGKELG